MCLNKFFFLVPVCCQGSNYYSHSLWSDVNATTLDEELKCIVSFAEEAFKKEGLKTRCCQVQMSDACPFWHCIGKSFHADQLHYPSRLKKNVSLPGFPPFSVCGFEFCPELRASKARI